ncbi:MAG: hypothetical protein H0U53_06750 [Actinobacteria bacterium]|nr:hypothetical protein [Actinomycetota bacterium]
MGLEVTPEAIEVLRRSLELTDLSGNTGGGVRLRGSKGLGGGFDVQIEFAEGPQAGEISLSKDGINVYVDPSVTELYPDAVVTVEPQHETIVIRPSSSPNE